MLDGFSHGFHCLNANVRSKYRLKTFLAHTDVLYLRERNTNIGFGVLLCSLVWGVAHKGLFL